MPEVSVIIVTYRSDATVGAAVRSVVAQQGVSWELIVVDNGGGGAVSDIVRRAAPEAWFIRSPENEGYGRGNNRGFAVSRGELVLLLNPDAELASPDLLAQLTRAFRGRPQWGLAGLRTVDERGADTSPPAMGYPGQKRSGRDFSGLPGEIAWVIGAGLAVRRGVYAKLGGFDPEFFLYSEETDLCLRARELGWSIGHLPDLVIRHEGGASEAGRDAAEVTRRKMTGMHRFWVKHYGREAALRLARRDAWRAAWRLSVQAARAVLDGKHSAAWRKHRHYVGLYRASRGFLAGGGVPLGFEAARRTVTGADRTGPSAGGGTAPQ